MAPPDGRSDGDSSGDGGGGDENDDAVPPSLATPAPQRLTARTGPAPVVFRQGAHPPYGIRWYGITSLMGHLRNLTARAIATESVDTRDWMRAEPPAAMLAFAARMLGGDAAAPHLAGALGRPLWIDFVADSGDDRDVSAAVGAMVASVFELAEDGGTRALPRGDVLLLGGDVAYPVATADEIYRRLVLPWNESLRRIGASAERRVLLAVPGNHDWYDGLDGFGRLVRKRLDEPFRADVKPDVKDAAQARLARTLQGRAGRSAGLVARQLHLDEVGTLLGWTLSLWRRVRAIFRGTSIVRRRRLALRGYEPIQEASYFVLPLADGLDLYGADRQLGRLDFRQRSFFSRWRRAHPGRSVLFASGDPAIAYGERNDPGARMLSATGLALERDRVLFLGGDFHHYERRDIGRSIHVVAGGGGAFLHGTRIPPSDDPPQAAYPDAETSRRLVYQVPLKLALGRAGLLPHLALALLVGPVLAAAHRGTSAFVAACTLLGALQTLALVLVSHQGKERRLVAAVSAPFGLLLGFLPMLLWRGLPAWAPQLAGDTAIAVAYAFVGSLVFGVYLMVTAITGLEHQQAFTILGHPGFRHFVRLCVHPDGRVEGFAIGKDDCLAPGAPVLVDRFAFDARRVPGGPPSDPDAGASA